MPLNIEWHLYALSLLGLFNLKRPILSHGCFRPLHDSNGCGDPRSHHTRIRQYCF
ncbi:hypothetical protein VCHENC03_1641 [Vibrio sp. HENC-03]|nr:hypothetical protein VCHENC03_1641 [Vibrio sp. HENC-03]